jgi:hypothetical protein
MVVEVLVREVVPVLGLERLDAIGDPGVEKGVHRLGVQELLRKAQRVVDAAQNAGTRRAHRLRVQRKQLPHGGHRRPARLRVVADVENPAGLELACEKVHEDRAIGIGDPAPDAVHADEVEVREVAALAEGFEGLLLQIRPMTGELRQLLREARVGGIEVGPRPLGAARGRVDVHADALAKAQFAGVGHLGGMQAGLQEGQLRPRRIELGVVAVGVVDLGHVAGRPFGHGSLLVCLFNERDCGSPCGSPCGSSAGQGRSRIRRRWAAGERPELARFPGHFAAWA